VKESGSFEMVADAKDDEGEDTPAKTSELKPDTLCRTLIFQNRTELQWRDAFGEDVTERRILFFIIVSRCVIRLCR
jgi:hypothetical protein